MMTRTYLLTLLLACLTVAFLPEAHAAGTCGDLVKIMQSCRDKVIGTYGQKIIVEKKGEGGKTERHELQCKKDGNVRKKCGTGHFCVQPPGTVIGVCYRGGAFYNRYKAIVGDIDNFCNPIFAARQGGTSGYLTCIENAKCDVKKMNQCRLVLKKEKKSDMGGAIVGFLIFLLVSLLLEGLVLFGAMKLIDRHNPRNTILRGIMLGLFIGAVTFPLVYGFPLLGMLLSGSLLFGLIIILYQQGVFMPAVYTAFHILWVGFFFSFMVAGAQIGNDAWLAQPKSLRIKLLSHHASYATQIEEFDQEQKDRKVSAADQKKKKK